MKQLNADKLVEILNNSMRDDQTNCRVGGVGICVMQAGNELYKNYFGCRNHKNKIPMGQGDDVIFRLASMTKPITTVAVLIQVSRGLLDLDEPIVKLLPQFSKMQVGQLVNGEIEFKEFAKRPFTPRILLSHQNGLHAGTLGWKQGLGDPQQRQDLVHMVDYWSTLKLDFQPTEAQMYSPFAAFDVCARLVELTSGLSYNDFVKQEIFDPLGMVDTTYTPTEEQWSRFVSMHIRQEVEGIGVDEDDYTDPRPGCIFQDNPITCFSGGAGLCASLPDYVKFAEMLLHEGKLSNGKQFLPEVLIREMRRPCVPFEIMPAWERWGLGVRVVTDERHSLPVSTFGWSGAYGCHFWVDPIHAITVVYMRNSRQDGGADSQIAKRIERDVYSAFE